MCPSPLLNDIILGVLGRAQSRYPLEIVGDVFACWLPAQPATQADPMAILRAS